MSNRIARGLPGGLAVFRRSLRFIGNVELVLAIIALIIVVVLSGAQALLRYAFGTSLWWAQEISENTILFSYFLGISYVFKTRQYVLIEFVSSKLPLRAQIVLYLFAQILTLVFAVGTLYLLYLFLPTLLNMRTPVLSLPGFIPPLPLLIGSAMMVVTTIYYFSVGIWAFGGGAPGTSLADWEEVFLVEQPLVENIGEGE